MVTTKSRYHWIVVGSTLTLLGCALAAFAWADLQRIHNSARENNRTQLRLMQDILHDEFSSVNTSLDKATIQLSAPLESNDHSEILSRLELLKSALPAMETILARNIKGEVIAQSGLDRDLINTRASFSSDSQSPQASRLLSFSRSINSDGKLVLVVNDQVKSREGSVLGHIQARFSADYLQSRLAALQLDSNMRSGLVFEDGMLLMMTPEVPELVGTTLSYFKQPELDPKRVAEQMPAHEQFKSSYFASLQVSGSNSIKPIAPLYLVSWADTGLQQEKWLNEAFITLLAYLAFCAMALAGLRYFLKRQTQHMEAAATALIEQQLKDERFQLATESACIGVWEYNLVTKMVHWDSAMCLIYGVPEEQDLLPCSDWLKLVLPDDVRKLAQLLSEAQNHGETHHLQFGIRRANDGRIRHVQSRAKTHRNSDGVPFRMIGVNVDITVQRQFEDALREAEDRFRSSFEWAAIGMAMLDCKGKFLQVNKALSDILGYSERELLGFTFDAITHPQDSSQHFHLVREVLKGQRQSYQLEKRYIHKAGHVVWAHLSVSSVRDDKGRVIYFIAQIQDITERKRNEATLIEREHFLRTLSECLPGLVSYWSTDLRCHFANRNHEKWTGVAADKMRGQHMRKLLGDELFEHDQAYLTGVLRGEKQRFERKKPLPSGGYADLLVHLVPDVLYGKVEGFFSISTNITDFKAQQRELEKANLELVERTQQAEAASKAKGAFLANMSHEIRTPMNAIIGLLQLLEDTDLQARQRDYLSKIGSAADVLLHVLNDILDISRVEANKLELSCQRFMLDEVLSKATDLFAYRAEEKAIQLYCTKDPSCPGSMKGDRLRLAQILNNLLSNALKFTDKGRIHLQLHKPLDNGLLQFSVRDTGIGMSPEQCANLFKPFSQVDESSSRKYGGAGLGLSICKSLVELMGGQIWVESEPSVGTSFHFTIQCIEPEFSLRSADPHAIGHEQRIQPVPKQADNDTLLLNKRILVADDHKLNRMVASEMLKKWGAQVQLAENGLEAVQACLSGNYDVVLMDLQMPEMDGYEATARILQELGSSAPPIVAVTASASEQDRMDVLNAGMCEHVIKPFKKETLIEILLNIQAQQAEHKA